MQPKENSRLVLRRVAPCRLSPCNQIEDLPSDGMSRVLDLEAITRRGPYSWYFVLGGVHHRGGYNAVIAAIIDPFEVRHFLAEFEELPEEVRYERASG